MVLYNDPALDAAFSALADPTRRGVLAQLAGADASITELATRFHITPTGMKKHVGLLEAVGLVRTEKVGRTRRCRLGPQRLDREVAWIERHREAWSARFSALDAVLHQLQTEEASDAEPHDP